MSLTDNRARCAGLLVLRLWFGISMCVAHGWGKLIGGPERWNKVGAAGMQAVGIDWGLTGFGLFASVSETVFAILVAVGLFTRSAASCVAVTMVFAMMLHIDKGDPFSKVANPLELGIVFVAIAMMGPGRLSIDSWLAARKSTAR